MLEGSDSVLKILLVDGGEGDEGGGTTFPEVEMPGVEGDGVVGFVNGELGEFGRESGLVVDVGEDGEVGVSGGSEVMVEGLMGLFGDGALDGSDGCRGLGGLREGVGFFVVNVGGVEAIEGDEGIGGEGND